MFGWSAMGFYSALDPWCRKMTQAPATIGRNLSMRIDTCNLSWKKFSSKKFYQSSIHICLIKTCERRRYISLIYCWYGINKSVIWTFWPIWRSVWPRQVLSRGFDKENWFKDKTWVGAWLICLRRKEVC